jgi:hypothetical protein
MIRARIRREGRAVELGYFKTKAEVAAAQQVAHAILDESDKVKKQPPKLLSPQTLAKMIGQGYYDSGVEVIAQIAVRRTNLIKSLGNSRNKNWTGAAESLLKDAKWQALKDTPKETPKKVLADELRSLGLDPPSNLIG